MLIMPPSLLIASKGPEKTIFDMTAESISSGALIGWSDATDGVLATSEGTGPFGSVSGDLNAGGGTITDLAFLDKSEGSLLAIKNGSQSASNINIDGTDYTLTFLETSGDYDWYSFGPASSLFSDAVTYEVEVS